MRTLKQRIDWLERAFPGRTFIACICGAIHDSQYTERHREQHPDHQHGEQTIMQIIIEQSRTLFLVTKHFGPRWIECAQSAATIAVATGSVGATQEIGGDNVEESTATVERLRGVAVDQHGKIRDDDAEMQLIEAAEALTEMTQDGYTLGDKVENLRHAARQAREAQG